MKMRWVAPPNWPAVPEGFEPPEGWQPDPSWGPAPPGWQFWQPAEVDVHAGLPWWRRLGRGGSIGTAIALVIVVLAVLAATGAFSSNTRKFDGATLDRQIESAYAKRGVAAAVVDCPDGKPVKANTTFLCTLAHAGGFHFVKVDVLNSDGDINFTAEG